MEEDGKTEEGNPFGPINGEIESNFAGLEQEQKKKLRNKIVIWLSITFAVISIVSLIITLTFKGAGPSGDEPGQVSGKVIGNIQCIFEVYQGDTKILSDDFEYKNNLAIFIGTKRIEFSKRHNFQIDESKTVRFEMHGDSFSMKNMFKGVDKLKIINLFPEKNIKGKITSMESAFEGTSYLTELHFEEGFDTTQLTSMKNAFAFSNLQDIQFYNITLENVVDMSHMFHGSKIKIFAPNNFNTKSVQTMQSMFQDSYSLSTIVFPNFDTSQLTDMSYMFAGCDYLEKVDLNNLRTPKVTNMRGLFQGCTNLMSLSLSDNFDTSKVKDMSHMFDNVLVIKSIPVNNFKTESVTNMASMFKDCASAEFLVTSSFVTDNVEDMSYMFSNCKKLVFANSENFNTQKVKSFRGMYENIRLKIIRDV
jgi:surface protein